MKIEAPEKIYLSQERDEDGCYIDLMWHKHPYEDMENIQYVRTDFFIEKACSGIEKLLSGYIIRNFHFGDSYDIDRLIEDFKNYMKGE